MESSYPRKTKIVATLGPACAEAKQIIELLEAGANVLRCNTSHLSLEQAQQLYSTLTDIRGHVHQPFAILVDLQGPKLRLGRFSPTQDVSITQEVCLQEDALYTDESNTIPVAIENFAEVVYAGQKLVLGDGTPVLEVRKVEDSIVHTVVIEAGSIRERMGIAMPGGGQRLPALTDRDKEHVAVAAPYADFFALSFVRERYDIELLQECMNNHDSHARIIAKIERTEALSSLEDIMSVSDAIMIARGDLGVEIGIAHVPFAQRWILEMAQKHLKCVITATQVLESMVHADQPTRAEVTDIAGAIMDGTSALMLSGETASGDHPVETVSTLSSVITEIEGYLVRTPREVPSHSDARGSLVRAADQLASDMGIHKLLVPTDSGETARYAAALSHQSILALSASPEIRQQLAIERGVTPLYWDGDHGVHLPVTVTSLAMQEGWVQPNEKVVIAWGFQQRGAWSQMIVTLNLDEPFSM